jgi:hypothetical protein
MKVHELIEKLKTFDQNEFASVALRSMIDAQRDSDLKAYVNAFDYYFRQRSQLGGYTGDIPDELFD